MRNFIIKRILLSVLILFFVALIVYTIMRCIPTSYVETIALQRSTQPGSKSYREWLDQLNESFGMNTNIITGFFIWIKSAVTGDFGDSWLYGIPVVEKFKDVIWDSVILGAVAFVIEILIAIPLGIISATKQYSKTDYAVTVFALLGISLPTFFIATILKLVFSIHLGWFDLYGKVGRFYTQMTPVEQWFDVAKHFVLPVVTLTLVNVGGLMRYTRTNMLEVLNSDYIRTARAKGLSEKVVINKHAFRNIMIPIVTILGGTLPGLFSGAMITETLFQIPGIGYISFDAIKSGDIPFTMFYMTFMALLTLIGTLISDILYAVVDPRVRVN